MTSVAVKPAARKVRVLHPLPLRIMHWINVVAIFIMIGSGWKIYNDDVILGWLHFPDWAVIGKWAQYGLQWHFFGMWIFVLNGIAYLSYGVVTGRFRRKLFPISLRELFATIGDALRFRLGHGVILIGILIVITGLCLWKPVQFSALVGVLGGFQVIRVIHFLCMAAIVGFVLIHVSLALLVPKSLVAMVVGGPVVDAEPSPPPAPPPPPPLSGTEIEATP
jgi:thiosulfate reductase cytochrome b subunit